MVYQGDISCSAHFKTGREPCQDQRSQHATPRGAFGKAALARDSSGRLCLRVDPCARQHGGPLSRALLGSEPPRLRLGLGAGCGCPEKILASGPLHTPTTRQALRPERHKAHASNLIHALRAVSPRAARDAQLHSPAGSADSRGPARGRGLLMLPWQGSSTGLHAQRGCLRDAAQRQWASDAAWWD